MNRDQWAARLPIIQAFVEGRPLEVFSHGEWTDADENGIFDFENFQEWRLAEQPAQRDEIKILTEAVHNLRQNVLALQQPQKNENGFNINLLFDAVHKMQAQIGELQLQVQKLETGKRDDEPEDDKETLVAEAHKLIHSAAKDDPDPSVDWIKAMVVWFTDNDKSLDVAWGLLANAWRGDWPKAGTLWQKQARAWERKWHAYEKARQPKQRAFRQVFTAVEVDERVRQEVQLATDSLQRDVIALQKQNDKLGVYIRKAYAQEFEANDCSPTEDLLRHFFITYASQSALVRKQKDLIKRSFLMLDASYPIDPNDRRQLINDLAQA